MGNESAIPRPEHCWDVKGPDLRQYYAGFCRRALPDEAIWRLSMASSYLPKEHIGYQAWLTMVAGTDRFLHDLQDWAVSVGGAIAAMKPRLKSNARAYVPSYGAEWGRQAAIDGAILALYGERVVPAYTAQADTFGCHHASYKRIRDFVAGAMLVAAQQFEAELRLVHREGRLH